eukprot:CAMPEP_0204875198 /NCGR_PEP_ID=MMETSP1348-20121228/45302_1 /ASSEMBLY_ACC=CAM_ASM_000700 /TAXON_ID=215587 /ORGANISM="Aplanochytrium stocchinoi, Strain GSBS06" /LENGTH=360 /DNA_ID=CAMNT_0052031495 /DNA_START=185 /DNA_END=1267 /DNA_ORIENTATION=+
MRLLFVTGVIGFIAQLLLVVSFRHASSPVQNIVKSIETDIDTLRNRTGSECSSNSRYSCGSQCSECLREPIFVEKDNRGKEYGENQRSECAFVQNESDGEKYSCRDREIDDEDECEPVMEPPPDKILPDISSFTRTTCLNAKIAHRSEDVHSAVAAEEQDCNIIWVDQDEEDKLNSSNDLAESEDAYEAEIDSIDDDENPDTEEDKLSEEAHSLLTSDLSDYYNSDDRSDDYSDGDSMSSFSSDSSSSSSSSDSSISGSSSLSEIELLERQIGNPQGAATGDETSDGLVSLESSSSRSSSSSSDTGVEDVDGYEKNSELEVEDEATVAHSGDDTPPKIPPRTYVLTQRKQKNSPKNLVFG